MITDDLDRITAQWQRQGIADELLAMQLLGRFARLNKTLELAFLHCYDQHGLKQGEFDVLATLRRAGEPYSLSPSQLHQSMLLSSGAMSSRLDKLEQRQLIARRHCTEDRRVVHVSLTDSGKDLIEKVLPEHIALQQSLMGDLSPEQQQQLNALLKVWLAGLATLPAKD
ncbi:MarR family winged helix-turn-helix transcriptional regulator [Alkalimonas mucilaginosa]|uniref:MarR family transcriptional regulator n=1 Tax=Alkalimonas mucilaginosa TaxID=3057676 RepID=A0ABU7JF67_9GAMM|nr:MarR family transcriptional regulator [Alkalimonas sp. MEB004]MEE2024332.1 MarR family transcriptional regulator [Alkalimonas sp. MEB004]